jgi:hypothetical protein
MGLKIAVNARTHFTPDQIAKHEKACALLECVLNSDTFKERVLKEQFTHTNGKTSQQIYDDLMSGADSFNKKPDSDIDISCEMYTARFSKVIGYTSPGDSVIHSNSKFYDKFELSEIAMNIIHEYMHRCGFDHASASESTSVPYKIGYIVRDIMKTHEVYKYV